MSQCEIFTMKDEKNLHCNFFDKLKLLMVKIHRKKFKVEDFQT